MPTLVLESYVCCRCTEAKPREAFGTRTGPTGRKYRLTRCANCEYKRRVEKDLRNPDAAAVRLRRQQDASLAKMAARRLDPSWVEWFIVKDTRESDKKKGRENDLCVDFVRELITNGCRYCGETIIRMTVDRTDNNIGHIRSNVIPACIRCNLIRGSMPFAAWMMIAPSIRIAREEGLFGDWLSISPARLGRERKVVEPIGIEPMTSSMPWMRSPI